MNTVEGWNTNLMSLQVLVWSFCILNCIAFSFSPTLKFISIVFTVYLALKLDIMIHFQCNSHIKLMLLNKG